MNVAADCGALFESVVVLRHFDDLPDPRRDRRKVWGRNVSGH